jgi:FtsP/CotA-like multicopper oxidase with cupredoxin domain
MINTQLVRLGLPTLLLALLSLPAAAQSFRVQCPTSTITHPASIGTATLNNNAEPAYTAPTTFRTATAVTGSPNHGGYLVPSANVNGAIKCQQIGGGDGYATMADGTQTYMFSFGPLSGLADMASGNPGTQFPNVFNTLASAASGVPSGVLQPGDPALTDGATDYNGSGGGPGYTTGYNVGGTQPFTFNGAVGLVPDADCLADNSAAAIAAGACGGSSGIDGHVDPRQIEDIGVMNGNIPAPLMAIDEDDEFFLTLTNTGMIMRPDLFEQHTVHFHGYPNASSVYDGVPDASVAINIGGSFTYYYLAPDAGTYFWHCHITPPEHLQMGMVGQIYVRPRQDRVPQGTFLYASLQTQQTDLRTACNPAVDILCSNSLPAGGSPTTGAVQGKNKSGNPTMYDYNDGDGSTAYDVEYPLQIHGFDPNFHFVGMTFNPEAFEDMKDKYFLLNGRSYPDTVTPGPLATQASDGVSHFSQPLPSIINIPVGGKALLRISDLDVTEYQTLASLGIPMHVVGFNAKLLRDQAGNNTDYYTNSITLAGGESLDVILDACSSRNADGSCGSNNNYATKQVFYLYTPNLDHLSNDAENFGGLMTEVHICTSVDPTLKNCVL